MYTFIIYPIVDEHWFTVLFDALEFIGLVMSHDVS